MEEPSRLQSMGLLCSCADGDTAGGVSLPRTWGGGREDGSHFCFLKTKEPLPDPVDSWEEYQGCSFFVVPHYLTLDK